MGTPVYAELTAATRNDSDDFDAVHSAENHPGWSVESAHERHFEMPHCAVRCFVRCVMGEAVYCVGMYCVGGTVVGCWVTGDPLVDEHCFPESCALMRVMLSQQQTRKTPKENDM